MSENVLRAAYCTWAMGGDAVCGYVLVGFHIQE